MYCPVCAHDKTSTERTFSAGITTHRFRKCLACGFVFMSVEMPNDDSRWNDYKNGDKQISANPDHDAQNDRK